MDRTTQRRLHARQQGLLKVIPRCEACGVPVLEPGFCGACQDMFSQPNPLANTIPVDFTAAGQTAFNATIGGDK